MSHRQLLTKARHNEDHERNVGHERWLVSYSDFITLLFAFFVVMYSVSQVNENKYRTLSETLNKAFKTQTIDPSLEKSNPNSSANPSTQDKQSSLANLSQLAGQLQEQLDGFPIAGQIELGANENWLDLTLSSELLFDSASADTSDAAEAVFAELGLILAKYDNEIQVSGHTDDRPINNAEFKSNWELSFARARAVVSSLVKQGIQPKRLAAVAFAEFRPLVRNDSEANRALNRRVVIRVGNSAPSTALRNPEKIAEALTQNPLEASSADKRARVSEAEPDSEPGSELGVGETVLQGSIKPIKLKGGDLLFSSDPDLPRLRQLEREEQDAEAGAAPVP